MFKLSHVLLNPKKAERHPFDMLLVGFFYASLSLFISLWIFPEYASVSMVFLTVLSSLYIVQGAIIVEEDKERRKNTERFLLKEHAKTIFFLLFIFLGFLLAFVVWTIALPADTVDTLFNVQKETVQGIRSITGDSVGEGPFGKILLNNLRVMFISLLFAVFYGAGALFILAWNASVMGFVIGELARNTFGLVALPLVFTKYFLHGIPEMLAYFIAALAGGIVFVTVVRGDFSSSRLKKTAIDTIALIGISVLILILAAFIEVYISPFV